MQKPPDEIIATVNQDRTITLTDGDGDFVFPPSMRELVDSGQHPDEFIKWLGESAVNSARDLHRDGLRLPLELVSDLSTTSELTQCTEETRLAAAVLIIEDAKLETISPTRS